MAVSDNQDNHNEEVQGSEGSGFNKEKLLLIGAVVLIGGAAAMKMFPSDAPSSPVQRASSELKLGQSSNKPLEDDFADLGKTEAPTREGGFVNLDKRIHSTQRAIEKVVDRQAEMEQRVQRSLEQMSNQLNRQLSEVSDFVQKSTFEQAKNTRAQGMEKGKAIVTPSAPNIPAEAISHSGTDVNAATLPPVGDNPFANLSAKNTLPAAPQQPQMNAPSYGQIGSSTSMAPSGGPSYGGGYISFEQPTYVDSKGNKIVGSPGKNSKYTRVPSGNLTMSTSEQSDQLVDNTQKPMNAKGKDDQAEDEITVPAASYVAAKNLHGIDCPVGGEQAGGGTYGPVPVVIPISSVFRGPNGNVVAELGRAHLQGMCVGLSNVNRARIKVERLSYVGPDGEAQFVPANGYIIDKRDNSMDVAGELISTKGSDMAMLAATSALQAVGGVISQGEYTEGTDSNGQATKTLTGSAKTAAGAAAFSSGAQSIAEYYRSKAAASIDVVHIDGGIPFDFVTTTPIKVKGSKPVLQEVSYGSKPLI